ncbi:MAG: class I SAM-dependent methyltransferase [Janthinobacterium lividum]
MGWNQGYVSDIEYPITFFTEQSPAHLNFACVLNGVEPVPTDRPFTYFELGSGKGLTANILAASNPHGRFYATDFNPAQVVSSRQMSRDAGLENLEILEASFGDLAAGKIDLPPMDFITMYGVYSWINAENRAYVVQIIARYLKPGGVVYLNYNAMPGWTNVLPLQRLIFDHAGANPAPRQLQVARARDFVDQVAAAPANYFSGHSTLQYRLESLRKDKTGYLAHEYINDGWKPLYHADVARDLAPAKLNFIGSAELWRAFPQLYISADQQALLDGVTDGTLRETIKDYIHNTSFREDVYVRGARSMTPARQAHCLGQLGLAMTTVRGSAVLEFQTPNGKILGERDLYLPILEAIEQGPCSFTELAALPALAERGILGVAQVAAFLMASGQASVYPLSAGTVDSAPAKRLNQVIAELSMENDQHQALASSLLGTGIKAGLVQRLMYRTLHQEPERRTAPDITEFVAQAIEGQGRRLQREGVDLAFGAESVAELLPTVIAIMQQRLPVWEQLSMR